MQDSRPLLVEPAYALDPMALQVSNRNAKADRLAPVPATLATSESRPYQLASITATPELPRQPNPVTTSSVPAPSAAPAQDAQAAAPLPARKPKQAQPLPPPPASPSTFLDDEQIAALKTRMQLTPEQAEYWPAVEIALRDVVKTQMRHGRTKHAANGKANIDVNTPEVQRLIYAAMPLLLRLREDQKREVRKLARVIGLESVASQI
jgi:hypothetical protein